MYKLLIVEDDLGIAEAVRDQAKTWDIDSLIVKDFRNVLTDCIEYEPHIILLDIALPYFNGYHWCSEIRKISKVPIIFISSASDDMNIIMAMNMGADDFIAKPFDGNVLIAKIQALLRRTYDFAASVPVLAHRGVLLNTGDDTLLYNGTQIPLSKNEYRILLCLMENKGKIVSRQRLMERLWKSEQFVDENTLTVNVNRLRRKLNEAGLENFISTKFGVGYVIE